MTTFDRITPAMVEHRLLVGQAHDLRRELGRPDLTANMIATIMQATIDSCSAAYSHNEIQIGDEFARLNGVAGRRFNESPAARSAAVFVTALEAGQIAA